MIIEVTEKVFDQFPGYTALGAVMQLPLKPDRAIDRVALQALRNKAVEDAQEFRADRAPSEIPFVADWRKATRLITSEKKARCGFEILFSGATNKGKMVEISPSVDIYNAMSLIHQLPFGGENIDGFQGDLKLGFLSEPASFEPIFGDQMTAPEGELVWRDDKQVTCRAWNWFQCKDTAISEDSTNLLFIIDSLDPEHAQRAERARKELIVSYSEIVSASEECVFELSIDQTSFEI